MEDVLDSFISRSSWGVMTFASSVSAHGALAALVVAVVGALIAWLLFHLAAPAYEGIAAIVTFLVLVLVLLLL